MKISVKWNVEAKSRINISTGGRGGLSNRDFRDRYEFDIPGITKVLLLFSHA